MEGFRWRGERFCELRVKGAGGARQSGGRRGTSHEESGGFQLRGVRPYHRSRYAEFS